MAILKSPIGVMTQSIGGLNYRTWKGINVVAAKVTVSNQPNSPAQLEQRAKFAHVVELSRSLKAVIKIGFKSLAKTMTEFNVFVSRNLASLVFDDATGAITSLMGLQISRGNIPSVVGLQGVSSGPGIFDITWDRNSDGVSALVTDLLVVCIVDPITLRSVTRFTTATRDIASYSFDTGDALFSTNSVVVSAFFISADKKNISDNANYQYHGI